MLINEENKKNRIKIGKIVNTFGIKGELKVFPYVDYIDQLSKIYIDNKEYTLSKSRNQKNVVIIKLKGIDDINLVENYKNKEIEIDKNDLPKLEEGEYYIEDLIGLDVYTDEGKFLGKLDDIFNTGANDIYQVNDILLPAIPDVIKEIDIDNKKIIVHILKGLI